MTSDAANILHWIKHHTALWLFFAPFLFLSPAHVFGGSASSAHLVVMLYPEANDGRPGNLQADQAIRSAFATGSAAPIDVHNEYLDVSRAQDAGYQQLQAEFLQRKYAGQKVDLVIVGLASALDFALAHRAQLFPGVPIVMCAVEEREIKARQLPADVIGVPMHMDLAPTLDLALRLHPDTQQVVVIAGKSPTDAFWQAQARKTFHPYENRAKFTYLTGLPLKDLLQEVARLPERSIIYYLHVMEDGAGKRLIPANVAELIARTAPVPVYSHLDTFVGRGVVGGQVLSFATAGKDAASLGLRILAGQKPETIPIPQPSENHYVFDARQLERWAIPESRLPAGSEIRFREAGSWDRYKWQAIGVASLCITEALLIFGLLVQRASRRRADLALRESEARFRLMADTAPVMVWMSGPDKRCTYFNKDWLAFTGRPLSAELGDGWSDGVHPDDLAGCLDTYVRAFDRRQPFQMEYRLQRHDHQYRWILDTGVPRFEPDGTFQGYIGSCVDISDQKGVENTLRESQSELRALTGRLLRAQETERGRIARELHDDLNQSLAVLSVEMDLLSQKPPESATQLRQRMGELSARVKELSSSIHDLSHQLHPAILEQLGLVAAIRGLCKEWSHSHGVPIGCTVPERMPPIPEDTALCLYRIAQEALRNITKHSHARHAEVDLSSDAKAICLQIADDGTGFDSTLADGHSGLGLLSMRERLRLVGGEIGIASRPQAGTRINIRVPLTANGQINGDGGGRIGPPAT